MPTLAWGRRVSPTFRAKVCDFAPRVGLDPCGLMACMAFETGRTFSPSIRNGAGSGAVGLIQFMPQVAAMLGTSTAALAGMSAERQLDVVFQYFSQPVFKGKLKTIEDAYMAILWPAAVGKPNETVLFDAADTAHPARYLQNAGLDLDHNGKITKAEAASRVVALLREGRSAPNVYEGAL